MMLRIASAALFFLLSACGASQDPSLLDVAATSDELSRLRIEDDATYQSLAMDSAGLIQGSRSMKFLIDLSKDAKPVYFINANYSGSCLRGLKCAYYHYDFAVQALRIRDDVGSFNTNTYFEHTAAYYEPRTTPGQPVRRFIAGTLNRYQLKEQGLVYAIQLYPQDVAAEKDITAITQAVRAAVDAKLKLAFVATGNQQTTSTVGAELADAGILNLTMNAIVGATNYFPLHKGDAWGYLRLFPQNQDELMPTDIPVFDELPLDLSVVAGVITRAYQDTNSHINLKSKERNTPNMVLRDAGPDQAQLKNFIDQPVHLYVGPTGFVIEKSTAQEVAAKYKAKTNKRWIALKWNKSKDLMPTPFAAMCATSKPQDMGPCLDKSAIFGSKASNLGFLKAVFRERSVPQSAALSYDPVPDGFGVPLRFYQDFINGKGNETLKRKLNEFIGKEKAGQLSPAERNRLAAEIREMILNAKVDQEALMKPIMAAVASVGTFKKWKVRSSANAEDIDGFDGAGLHDSYSVKTKTVDDPANPNCTLVPDEDPGEVTKMEVQPKTFSCAIKGVYASLWNKRAIEERSFARIDHASIAMGLAILPAYDSEADVAANSVVVTRVINSPEIYGYALSIQKDNNTVTNPAPGTWSEQTVFGQAGSDEPASLSTVRYALPVAGEPERTETVLPKDITMLMARITQKVEVAYCQARGNSYLPREPWEGDVCLEVAWNPAKPKALDLEMKYLANGQFVLKQVREFSGK